MKIITVIGARPQFIKAAMVSKCLNELPGVEEKIVHTGQHYDEMMSDVFFTDLEIPVADYNLGIGSFSHGAQTGRMLEKTEDVLLKEKPDCLLVYGDTNSTLAGALSAVKHHTPVAHVEAGLRSFNRIMPEEINRVLTDHMSDYLFVPTEAAVKNLKAEGIPEEKIFFVGDVMYDASLYYMEKAEKERGDISKKMGLENNGYVLATIHRAENTDNVERLKAIMEGLALVSQEIPVVLPLHPRTGAKIKEAGIRGFSDGNFLIINPVSYLDMILLEKHSRLVVTDSGGVQKEAYFFGVPCATLRGETEWVELVDNGWNKCFISDSKVAIRDFIISMLDVKGVGGLNLYGEGNAARAILDVLINSSLVK